MILSNRFKISYYTQDNTNILNNISNFLSINNYVFNDKSINFDTINNKESLYNFSDNLLNIPKNC